MATDTGTTAAIATLTAVIDDLRDHVDQLAQQWQVDGDLLAECAHLRRRNRRWRDLVQHLIDSVVSRSATDRAAALGQDVLDVLQGLRTPVDIEDIEEQLSRKLAERVTIVRPL
jgi:hypothetical protein